MENRPVALTPRLEAAYELLTGCSTVADIGCDHGKLICALLQTGAVRRGIAVDVSAPSLKKAEALAARTGVLDRLSLRVGDGFSALTPGEADAAALLGMGGTLMAQLLDACATPFCGAKRVVFQPMRAAEDIRAWLYAHNCRIEYDGLVRERGRLYQLFAALPPGSGAGPLPKGWPEGYFALGYTAFANRDPLLQELALEKLGRAHKRLNNAPHAATLQREAAALTAILAGF